MPDLANFNQQKQRILSLIRMKGPSLPVQIARGINVSPLFAGAFLSELYGEKKIIISNMKVGSSPLYYIQGQETMLENFSEYLNIREKEAFFLLKKEKILDDNAQTPIIRVALRAIKDFAVPIRVKTDNDSKLYWRHFSVSDGEFRELIQKSFNISEEKPSKTKEEPKKIEEEIIEPIVKKIEKEVIELPTKIEEKLLRKEETIKESSPKKPKKKEEERNELPTKKEEKLLRKKETNKESSPKKPKKKEEESHFSKKIKEYLAQREIEISKILIDKKKEFTAKIRMDMPFGKQEFFLVAKEKKSVNDNDLMIAMQNAQNEKMPALFLSLGDLHKKAKEYLKEWGNLVKYEKIKK